MISRTTSRLRDYQGGKNEGRALLSWKSWDADSPSESPTYYAVDWGQAGDIPARGDYDGDSKADTTVFRPSNST